MPDECERDCNANGMADSCDVADGTSEDRNADGIPDECTLGFSLVPVRATGEYQIRGNEITVEYGGQRMIFDLYLSGWDPDLDGDLRLHLYQAAIEFSTFTSGDRGYLKLADTIPCTNNDDCLGDSLCEDTAFCDEYGAVNIDKRRPNFVFAGLDAIAITAIRATEVLYGALLWDGAVRDPGIPQYGGTLILDSSADAAGTFLIEFEVRGTYFLNESSNVIPLPGRVSAVISIISDCNGNGVDDAEDIAGGSSEDCNANGIPDECLDLDVDCNSNNIPDECDVASGSSVDCNRNVVPDECEVDCNGNHVPDDCDIESGSSINCNKNSVPDECETDCNHNDVPDDCDIAAGASDDCNVNDIPDECDIAAGDVKDDDRNGIPDACEAAVLFVDGNARGLGDGTSWGDAFVHLQDALLMAAGGASVSEIWVETGSYTPMGGPDTTFELVSGVAVYGGFAGDEVRLDQRDPLANPTVLDGAGYIRHVVTARNVDRTAVLDGLVITNGFIFGEGGFGAGIFCENSNATFRNCDIVANSALEGSGMWNRNGSPVLIRCRFIGNRFANRGGGLMNDGGHPILIGCTFRENNAHLGGGGMYTVDANPLLISCTFINNSAIEGGAFLDTSGSSTIVNSTFIGNRAFRGGGVANWSASPSLINCTFSENRASHAGGGIYDARGRSRVVNSIFWGNTVNGAFGESEQIHFARPESFDVNHSCVQGWTGTWGGQGNTGNDPLFLDVVEGDLRLRPESPCIDAGDSSVLPPDDADLDGDGDTTEPIPVAIDGLPRFMNEPFAPDVGIGPSAIVDMGAYEYPPVFTLDVQPGRCPNRLSPRGRGIVNVAIVATPEFEPWRINLASLALTRVDGTGGAVTPLKRRGRMAVRFADVASPFLGNGCDCYDLRADGIVDRVVTFSARDVFDLLELGSIEPGAPIPLRLVGQLIDGSVFEVSDCLQLQERSRRGP